MNGFNKTVSITVQNGNLLLYFFTTLTQMTCRQTCKLYVDGKIANESFHYLFASPHAVISWIIFQLILKGKRFTSLAAG